MVIDFNNVGPTPNNNQRAKESANSGQTNRPEQPAAQKPAQPGDSVSFSDKAKGLKDLESSIKSEPDVNKERVAQIKAALEDGSYSVNADKVAQKMLDFDSSVF